jgi:hypothetical protein
VTTMRSPELGGGSAAAPPGATGAFGATAAALVAGAGRALCAGSDAAGTAAADVGSGLAWAGEATWELTPCTPSDSRCAGSTVGSPLDRRKNHAPPMIAAAAMSSATRKPPDVRSGVPTVDGSALGASDLIRGAGASGFGPVTGASAARGAWQLPASTAASQLSSSSSGVGGGLEDGIEIDAGLGLAAASRAAWSSGVGGGLKDGIGIDAGLGLVATSQASSSSGVGGGHDSGIGLGIGAEEADDLVTGADAGGTDGAGIPMSVPPARDAGGFDGLTAEDSAPGGGLLLLGAGIPISVCCFEGRTEPGRELPWLGVADRPSAERGESGGFDAFSPAGAGGSFEARSSVMAS